jgi:hypothetical protein
MDRAVPRTRLGWSWFTIVAGLLLGIGGWLGGYNDFAAGIVVAGVLALVVGLAIAPSRRIRVAGAFVLLLLVGFPLLLNAVLALTGNGPSGGTTIHGGLTPTSKP